MRFDDRFLEEIKARLRPSDVIGRTVKLRRQGREYVGLSPFTKEKSPSFYVNDEKGFFHDFSSGKHGDLIAFLQETQRLSFREAIEQLAAEAGVPLPTPDPREAETERRRQDLHGWMEEAARWFEAQLRRPTGDPARRYLDGRGLPEAERARFGLGYAPAGRTGLKDHLVAKGARPAELVEAGLLIAPEDSGAPYDRFRDRIIFPITDGRGRIVSFGGRALDPQAKAKYLNGPETALFHKGSTLYGLPEARKLLHAPGASEDAALVVVEGYMDAIACQRAGIAAVAPLGTALTEEQMAALWRLTPEPVLCFDGDAAGQRAAHKVIDRALPLLKPGRSFRFALPTGGKDVDEVLREQGAEALREQLAETKPLAEVLFERERLAAEPLDTPERRTGLKVALRKLAGLIADRELAEEYKDELISRFMIYTRPQIISPAQAAGVMSRYRWDKKRRQPIHGASVEGVRAAKVLSASIPPFSAAAANGVIFHPMFADQRIESVQEQTFGQKSLSTFADGFIQIRIRHDELNAEQLHHDLVERGFSAQMDRIRAAAARAHAPFLSPDYPTRAGRELWSQLLDEVTRLAGLERALSDLKLELSDEFEVLTDAWRLRTEHRVAELWRIKAERDVVRQELGSGTFWERAVSHLDPRILH
ncbi:DNA primase [Caulobacter sp. S45]|uniref:DNA primase n=1 Tax=Caulobacter sp. S45 TaxID=1641861 RepID=UPI00157743E8|nr:DNA primase [Caulobacter sp. S45]